MYLLYLDQTLLC